MSSKQDEILLSQYNLLLSRYKELSEQYKEKLEQWSEREAYFKSIEQAARKLCEAILVKDSNEMKLGSNYSWQGLSIDEMLHKAANSFRSYNKNRTELMQHLLDLAEKRQFQIESLEDQISQFISGTSNTASPSLSTEEIVATAEKKKQIEEAKDRAPNMVKAAAESGKVQMIIEDSDEVEIEGEMTQVKDLIEKNEQAKLTSHSIPIQESSKKKKKIKKAKDDAIMAHVVDLHVYEDLMTDSMWEVMRIIGSYGISKYPEIEAKALEETDLRKTKIRSSTQSLFRMDAILQEVLNLPLSPKCFVYKLSDIGYRLYKIKYGKDPVESELDKIIKEHDNPEHGYGIIDVVKILNGSGFYQEVTGFNRKNAITLKDGKQYIPDIICVTKRYKEYIEYERGYHTQSDFNEKCNKMTQVTRFLNFVTPNKEVLMKRLVPQIDAWIASRDPRSLRNIKVRLTTALALKDADMKDDSCWQVIYDLRRGAAPIKTIE